MRETAHRWIALLTLAAMLATTCGLRVLPAQAGARGRRNTTIALGALTLYGLLAKKKTVAIAGALGTAVAYRQYRIAKKREARRQTYSSTSSGYSAEPYRYRSSSYRSSARRSYRRHRIASGRPYRRSYQGYRTASSTRPVVSVQASPPYAAPPVVAPVVAPVGPASGTAPATTPATALPPTLAANPSDAAARSLPVATLSAAPEATPSIATNPSSPMANPMVPAQAPVEAGLNATSFVAGFLAALFAAAIGVMLAQLLRRRDASALTPDPPIRPRT